MNQRGAPYQRLRQKRGKIFTFARPREVSRWPKEGVGRHNKEKKSAHVDKEDKGHLGTQGHATN